jgi:hypothetical protein
MPRTTYRQDPETKKFIEKSLYIEKYGRDPVRSMQVRGDIEPFVSQVDGSIISTRRDLAEHNTRNSVTNTEDYSEGWFETKGKEHALAAQGKTDKDRKERKIALAEELGRRGV